MMTEKIVDDNNNTNSIKSPNFPGMDSVFDSYALAGVEVQWSSHTMDTFGWTSRGPLQLLVVQVVVQWFASI